MKLNTLFVAILLMTSCANKEKKEKVEAVAEAVEEKVDGKSQELPLDIYDYAGFEKFLNLEDDKTYVVNFWATWCGPCVKELPHFEKLNAEYQDENVEVLLVSLDFPHMYEKKLIPFIEEKDLQSKVIVLDDADMNSWIPKVSKDWSGAIPATVIYNKDSRKFYEQSFTYSELEHELKQFLN